MNEASKAAMDVVRRYFAAMDEWDPEAAAACFTEDAFYSHIPFPMGIGGGFDKGPNVRVEVKGRDRILALFQARGYIKIQHELTKCVSDGTVAFIEGWSEGEDLGRGTFVASMLMGQDGLIASYAAYSSRPAVGHALASEEAEKQQQRQ
jgi:ketosteroid isomerase-like protein